MSKTYMKLSFVGYESHGAKNPDGSMIYDGQPVYVSPEGVYADGYFLLEHGFQVPLGDNPEVPAEQEHWFKKKLIKVGDELTHHRPFLRVEEVLTCADGELVIRVKPFYEDEVLNKTAKSSVWFAHELEEKGYLAKGEYRLTSL